MFTLFEIVLLEAGKVEISILFGEVDGEVWFIVGYTGTVGAGITPNEISLKTKFNTSGCNIPW